jgi:hypothetical protein
MIRLQSSALQVDVLPEVGGKVGQIRHKLSGRDLLIPPQRPYRTIPIDGDWLKYDLSGMDDCFPNVAGGAYPAPPLTSAKLTDLGEWTHSEWNVRHMEPARLVMERTGNTLPYFAVKTIRFADQQTLEFSYSVENRGTFPLRYIWSAHPLIAVQESFRLRLPAGPLSFRLFPPTESVYSWPLYQGTDISTQWIPLGTTLKTFITGLTEGWCALELPEHNLRFSFDTQAVPVVGIWINNFGFPRDHGRPFRCIAIEPCTSPSDLLDHLDPNAYSRIAPGSIAEWSMRLTVSARSRENP